MDETDNAIEAHKDNARGLSTSKSSTDAVKKEVPAFVSSETRAEKMSMSQHSPKRAMRQRPSTDNADKALDRLIREFRDKLDGNSVKIRPPAGDGFKRNGPHEVWGMLARQAGKCPDAAETRAAIENVLTDYQAETAAEVWARLDDPEPVVIPIDGKADSDSAVYRTTELSNADRFLERHGDDVRYVVDTGDFLTWDSRRWVRDSVTHARVRAMMSKVSRWIDDEIRNETNEDIRSSLRKWATACERKAIINASADLLATRKRIWINASDLDTRHELLNCPNGTVDLRTGIIRPHNRADLLTCITPIDYVSGARHPLWDDTVVRFIPDESVREYVQRLVGYGATGLATEKAFPIAWGGGNNGKGSIFETIVKRALGSDYAAAISPDAIVNNGKQGQQAQERANIKFHGKRLVLFEETADGDTLDAGAVKRLASGGDALEARALFRESFNFSPTHSVFLLTNAEPRVNCFDLAMKTRVKFLHFGVQVEPNGEIRHQLENDPDVHRAVLAWVIEGAVKYLKERLTNEPHAVKEATERYFRDQDTFGQFLSECFEVAEPGNDRYSETKKDIYERYLSWADDQGLKHPLSKIRLGRELEKRGFPNIGNADRAEYDGLKLRNDF